MQDSTPTDAPPSALAPSGAARSSGLGAYRRIFTPATTLFSITGLVARLPISMVGLGIVLLAEDATGSYAFAGAVSAVALIANAVLAVPQGRLIDRLGQAPVLMVAISIWGVALAGGIWSLEAGWPHWTTFLLAAIAGASLPGVGACVRTRWSHALRDRPEDLHTAFSFEAVADETVFLVGPIVVTMLATSVHPAAGLAAALVAGVAGTWAFAVQRGTEPPAHPAPEPGVVRAPMPWTAIVPLTVLSVALGVLFGAAEVATVAFSEEEGNQQMSGFLLAVWALGSLLAGVVSGAIAWRSSSLTRVRWGAAGMLAATLPLALVPSIPVMFLVLLLGGVAISPTLIATMSLVKEVLPPARLTEGMAFVQTGLGVGIAPGAAIAGVLVDASGASTAYLMCAAGGALALAAALGTRTPAGSSSVAGREQQLV